MLSFESLEFSVHDENSGLANVTHAVKEKANITPKLKARIIC